MAANDISFANRKQLHACLIKIAMEKDLPWGDLHIDAKVKDGKIPHFFIEAKESVRELDLA